MVHQATLAAPLVAPSCGKRPAPRYNERVHAATMHDPSESQSPQSAADEEVAWLAQVGAGDARAYRALSDRYLAGILNYATRILSDRSEAEDVAQETFLRLWTHAERWEPRARPSTWLYRVAHNLCIDRLRKHRPTSSDDLDRRSTGDRPSGLLERKELAAEVQGALDALPERQRAAIVLSHYQGLSNPEIAAVLEVGVEAVESLLSRGRRTLRQRLSPLRQGRDRREET